MPSGELTIVALGDTHGYHEDLDIPSGDVLVHAGDFTRAGELDEVIAFNAFLDGLPHPHKIVIAGNHDWCFQLDPLRARHVLTAATYLEDEAVVVSGIKFYGSPWQPWFFDWAFNLPRGEALAEKWALIPDDVDVLVTHGPPVGFGDCTGGEHVGCEDLLARVREVQPRFHIFGHIHEGTGMWKEGDTTLVNASCDEGMGEVRVLQYRL